VLVATALYLVPAAASHWCADHLVDLAAWVAQATWPWLARAAEFPGASWALDASWPWLLLAVPSVLCVLAPLPMAIRVGGLALLCSGFLVRAPRLAAGSVELVVFDVGASRAVLLRTANHQLLLGAGEGFGTAGRRFERVVLPALLRATGPVDVVLDRADRDSLQALALARSRLSVREARVAAGRSPPELLSCVDARWQWDGVAFSRRATSEGCGFSARVGDSLLVVAPSRMSGGGGLEAGNAVVQVLPRRARDAAAVLERSAAGALLLASLSSTEWQSAGWRALRDSRDSGHVLWTTANQGDLRLVLRGDGQLVRSTEPAWRPGIWVRPGGCFGL